MCVCVFEWMRVWVCWCSVAIGLDIVCTVNAYYLPVTAHAHYFTCAEIRFYQFAILFHFKINSLEFDQNHEITAIISTEHEIIPLTKKINPTAANVCEMENLCDLCLSCPYALVSLYTYSTSYGLYIIYNMCKTIVNGLLFLFNHNWRWNMEMVLFSIRLLLYIYNAFAPSAVCCVRIEWINPIHDWTTGLYLYLTVDSLVM